MYGNLIVSIGFHGITADVIQVFYPNSLCGDIALACWLLKVRYVSEPVQTGELYNDSGIIGLFLSLLKRQGKGMTMRLPKHGLTGILLITFIAPALSLRAADVPDYDRELRLRDEIVDTIVVGDPLDLNDGERDFLAVMTESDADRSKGAVLILHGRGYHPTWPAVVQPLRERLPEHGWATLSLQMPVLHKEAKYYDYVPLFPKAHGRIAAGIRYLRDEGYENVVILAHSCGVHMAMSYVRENGDGDFDAYIGVGMGATDYGQPMRRPLPLDRISKPVLDVYGSNDFPAVLRLAVQRKSMLRKAGNDKSDQVMVNGADHYFDMHNHAEVLGDEVLEWLDGL